MPSSSENFSSWCHDMVRANFRSAIQAADGEWLPLMVGGPSPDARTYMELQDVFEEHGKDVVLEAWAPIQVQVEGWTEAALITAAWTAPLRDDGTAPSEDPQRSEVVYIAAYIRGSRPWAFTAPIIRTDGKAARLGRWSRAPGPLEGKGVGAMQAAVDGDLLLDVPAE